MSNWLSFWLICFCRWAIFSLSWVTATTWSELFGSWWSCMGTILATLTGVGPFVSPDSDCGGSFVTSPLWGLLLWLFTLHKSQVSVSLYQNICWTPYKDDRYNHPYYIYFCSLCFEARSCDIFKWALLSASVCLVFARARLYERVHNQQRSLPST